MLGRRQGSANIYVARDVSEKQLFWLSTRGLFYDWIFFLLIISMLIKSLMDKFKYFIVCDSMCIELAEL